MSNKRILLPESNIRERDMRPKKPRKSLERQESAQRLSRKYRPSAPELTQLEAKQRSEAIGLVFMGFSAFSLSLLYYLSSSKVSAQINACMVYVGMGVYLIPSIIGLWGVQRFFERPFTNIKWRLGGLFGVIVFGLGLLGLEGGKLGAHTLNLFARRFGELPSRVLFVFLFLSSLIFALDILYKDLIASIIIACGLISRFLIKVWELFLKLAGMGIGAVKTTFEAVFAVCAKIKELIGRYLSERAEKNKAEEAKAAAEAQTDLCGLVSCPHLGAKHIEAHHDVEEATIIPAVQSWQNEGEATEQNAQETNKELNDSAGQNAFALGCAASQLGFQSMFGTEPALQSFSYDFLTAEKPLNESQQPSDDLRVIVELEDSEAEEAIEAKEADIGADGTADAISQNKAALQNQSADLPGVQGAEGKSASAEEPVYLEDNRIDHEIKTAQFSKQKIEKEKLEEAELPPIELLQIPPVRSGLSEQSDLQARSAFLIKTLDDFGIKASVTAIVEGPAVSRFEIKPAPGVKVSRITSLADDIALALAAQSVRIEAPIPGKSALGIEIPNTKPMPVYFYDLVKNEKFKKCSVPLNVALGVTINGQPVFADLSDMPHLLIAGSTGSGKSVCVNTIIASILFQARSTEVKFIMVDPKMVELSSYNGIPHLIAPVVTDPAEASDALKWAVEEMTRRYELLAKCGCKKITSYNENIDKLKEEIDEDLEPLPFIVIVIDELADLMMTASAEVEGSICRLAQMARAVGIHLVIATQRPSVNVLTGLIKTNLPTRIAFAVASVVDSRTILDVKGAERLLGKGDMLFLPKGRNKPLRVQGAYVSDRELSDLVNFVKGQGTPDYIEIAPEDSDEDEDDDDEYSSTDSSLVKQIVSYIETQEKTSTSMLQRKFRIGYNRAARIMDELEEKGIVSPTDGTNKRRVLIGRSGI